MTEEQFRQLCQACDRVLLAEDTTKERVAIPWLHILRGHPYYLKDHEELFESLSHFKLGFVFIYQIVRRIAHLLRLAWRIQLSSGSLWFGDIKVDGQFDFVFVSHLLSPLNLSNRDDFYFGSVPADLVKNGKSVLLILINHTGATKAQLERLLPASPIARVVVSSGLGPMQEYKLWRRLKKEAHRLIGLAKTEKEGLYKAVLQRASFEATADNAKLAIRIALVVKTIVSNYPTKILTITYEGFAWERIVLASAREADPRIKCFAYQHSAIFPLQHALLRSVGSMYDPDLILTAGQAGNSHFEQLASHLGIPLAVLGSPRYISDITRDPSAVCLVLPEGIVEECINLFSFSLLCARACPEITFVWRLHPILSFKTLIRKFSVLRDLPLNIEISSISFSDDIARSKWALYRGTTAIITAAANGVIPIYLRHPGDLLVDPLFGIASNHHSIENTNQFIQALGHDNATPTVIDYCKNYYAPLNAEVLVEAR